MYKAQGMVVYAISRQQEQQQRTRQPLHQEQQRLYSHRPAQQQDAAAVATTTNDQVDEIKRQHGHSNHHGHQHHQHHHQPHHYSQNQLQQHYNVRHQQHNPDTRRYQHQKQQHQQYMRNSDAHPGARHPLRQQQPNTNCQQQRQERHPIYKKLQVPEVLSAASSTLDSVKEAGAPTKSIAAKENDQPSAPPQLPLPKPCLDRAAQLPVGIRDVDRHDDCMTGSAYAKDIFVYLAELELRYTLPEGFLVHHAEVSERSRSVLVDWLIQLTSRLDLQADTFHLGVRLLDHYLAIDQTVTKRQLQLVGATAIWLASKFEEVYCISVSDLLHVCAGACNRRELMAMEVRLVSALDFHLLPPLPITFLRRLSKVACVDSRLHCTAKYLLELATLSARLAWRPASQLAAAAMRVTLGSEGRGWSEQLAFYSGYALADLRGVSAEMARACATAAASASLLTGPDSGGSSSSSGDSNSAARCHRFVYQKYRSSKSFGVSACPQLRADSQYLADLIAEDAN